MNPNWNNVPVVKWRGLTQIDSISGYAVLSFEDAGAAVRLRLAQGDLAMLVDVASSYLRMSGVHSSKSSGSAHLPGSIPDEGKKV